MKNSAAVLCVALGSLLTVAVGCGKTEQTAPTTTEVVQTPVAPAAEPAPAAEKVVPQSTNVLPALAALTEPKESIPAAPAKAADPIAPPVELARPETAAAPIPGTNQTPVGVAPAKTSLASLSENQMVKGLQEALGKGLQQAITRLGQEGGFLTNANVRIPMPEKMQKVESTLRAMKQGKLADDFIITMNRAAEQAVPEAASVFADALKQLTIEDAKSILSGPSDAATQYFQRTTQTNLYARFYPIVQNATAKTGVTAAYKSLIEKANVTKSLGSLGTALGGALLDKDSLDLDAYVTNKSLEGLFKMVAEEEKQIRQNPVARTSDTLQKVFGALGK